MQFNIRYKKILYQATHRGTKEMDIIIGGFVKSCIFELSEKEVNELESILILPDHVIYNMLTNKQLLTNNHLINKIREYMNQLS